MGKLLGVVDRASILAYLGRPKHRTRTSMDQDVRYPNSIVKKRHTFFKTLPAKKGYIELFDLGYVYLVNEAWFIHWNHTEQLTLDRHEVTNQSEDTHLKHTIEDFSLSNMAATEPKAANVCGGVEAIEKRENESLRERSSESESNQKRVATEFSDVSESLTPLEKAILRVSKEPRG